jgi:hypothetical protein
VLEEKFVGRTVYEGRWVAVSTSDGAIAADLPLVPLSNLKIQVEPVPGTCPGGEIYAKVISAVTGTTGQTRIRFTSVSPELQPWLLQAAKNVMQPSPT